IEEGLLTGARLILLHVISTGEAMAADASGMPYYDPAGALDTASKTLEPYCEFARKRAIICDQVVREGHPAQQVLSAARQFRADRILLGTRSRSKVSKLLIGSVAEQVLRSVHIPVITVGPEAHLPVESNQPERVCCTPPLCERPPVRAQCLPARLPQAWRRGWFFCMFF